MRSVLVSGVHGVYGGDCGTGHPPNWGGGGWKYTHMKYNTTLEVWVYPTDDAGTEYTIYSKHTGYANGDFLFALRKISGSLRAAFLCQVDNNGGSLGGRAGVRGAHSAVSIPLNRWTHVAATFDTNGPDRNPADPAKPPSPSGQTRWTPTAATHGSPS